MRYNKNDGFTLLFADDLEYIVTYRKARTNVENKINKYLGELEKWSKMWRLTFAPNKCSYTVFSRGKRNIGAQNLDMRLYGERIPRVSDPKFLGIRFDPFLSGKNQIAHLKQSCLSRINILKILSHKSWHLEESTLMNIYQSLIRSLIDYTGFMFDYLSTANKTKLEAIQNYALRVIFRKPREFGNENLLELAKIDTISARSNAINNRFLEKAEIHGNPIITDLIEEYLELRKSKTDKGRDLVQTLLCRSSYMQDQWHLINSS